MLDLLFLSTDAWRPEGLESDTVSLLINGQIMVDTGWHPVHNLIREGVPVENVRTLLFTHMHQDHCMGLPAMLFYHLNSFHDASSLSIYGPTGLHEIVHKALDYAGKYRDFPDVREPAVHALKPEEALKLADISILCAPSLHAIAGLMYRFEDSDGHSIVYSGDTAPTDVAIRFAHGADVLIHEHSWGATRSPKVSNNFCHSSAEDAALCARAARVKSLYLVHAHPACAEESLQAARAIFPNTLRPVAGTRIRL